MNGLPTPSQICKQAKVAHTSQELRDLSEKTCGYIEWWSNIAEEGVQQALFADLDEACIAVLDARCDNGYMVKDLLQTYLMAAREYDKSVPEEVTYIPASVYKNVLQAWRRDHPYEISHPTPNIPTPPSLAPAAAAAPIPTPVPIPTPMPRPSAPHAPAPPHPVPPPVSSKGLGTAKPVTNASAPPHGTVSEGPKGHEVHPCQVLKQVPRPADLQAQHPEGPKAESSNMARSSVNRQPPAAAPAQHPAGGRPTPTISSNGPPKTAVTAKPVVAATPAVATTHRHAPTSTPHPQPPTGNQRPSVTHHTPVIPTMPSSTSVPRASRKVREEPQRSKSTGKGKERAGNGEYEVSQDDEEGSVPKKKPKAAKKSAPKSKPIIGDSDIEVENIDAGTATEGKVKKPSSRRAKSKKAPAAPVPTPNHLSAKHDVPCIRCLDTGADCYTTPTLTDDGSLDLSRRACDSCYHGKAKCSFASDLPPFLRSTHTDKRWFNQAVRYYRCLYVPQAQEVREIASVQDQLDVIERAVQPLTQAIASQTQFLTAHINAVSNEMTTLAASVASFQQVLTTDVVSLQKNMTAKLDALQKAVDALSQHPFASSTTVNAENGGNDGDNDLQNRSHHGKVQRVEGPDQSAEGEDEGSEESVQVGDVALLEAPETTVEESVEPGSQLEKAPDYPEHMAAREAPGEQLKAPDYQETAARDKPGEPGEWRQQQSSDQPEHDDMEAQPEEPLVALAEEPGQFSVTSNIPANPDEPSIAHATTGENILPQLTRDTDPGIIALSLPPQLQVNTDTPHATDRPLSTSPLTDQDMSDDEPQRPRRSTRKRTADEDDQSKVSPVKKKTRVAKEIEGGQQQAGPVQRANGVAKGKPGSKKRSKA
ncbi:hypothetical protein CPC08DRAFT_730011 [Agrocybe pediades]|nr:hypothetical protein CPC08DRAFT_730011 [Agrocybe pediades]